MTIADQIGDRLTTHGIDTVFGIPGSQTLPLNGRIEDRNDIRFVMARHETAITHEAWGYAETSGEMAATLVVPGPGDTNAMNGLKNALNDSTPLLHVSVETDPDLRGGDPIHEMEPDTYDNAVKENITVETAASTIAELERALDIAQTPPKGPVRIGIPKSFLSNESGTTIVEKRNTQPVGSLPHESIAEAAELLNGSESPVVIAGGGVRAAEASDELRTVAERLGAPVATTYKGKGVFPEDHRLSLGTLGRGASTEKTACIEDSDVVLGVGTDVDAQLFRDWSLDISNLIHVTLEASDIGRGYASAVALVADARNALTRIGDHLDERDDTGGVARVKTVREADVNRLAQVRNASGSSITTAEALAQIRKILPRDGIATVDVSGIRTWTTVAFEAYGPRTYVTPGSWGTMGTGVPSAIGAQVANPDRNVVALTGDGGLFMCMHELHTAVAEDIPIIVVVFNNNDYAIISRVTKRDQSFPDGYEWADSPVMFQKLASSLGMQASKVTTSADLREEVEEAMNVGQPTLIEVPVDANAPGAKSIMKD